MSAPDIAGVAVGWRAWHIRPGQRIGSVELVSMNGTPWPAGAPLVAGCTRRARQAAWRSSWSPQGYVPRPEAHEPPVEGCTCGVYAARDLAHLRSQGYHRYGSEWLPEEDPDDSFTCVGEVSLWGEVVLATRGYRAQSAYPKRILLPFEAWRLARPLQEAYQVPVKLENTLKGDPR